MRLRSLWLLGALAIGATAPLVACGDDDGVTETPDASDETTTPPVDGGKPDSTTDSGPVAVLPAASNGSTIAISPDESRVVVANKDVGSVTIFSVDYPAGGQPVVAKVAEIVVGGEPSQVTISPDNSNAFVALRKDSKVVRISGLKSTPVKGADVVVGSEPTGIALTPTGATAWVANWVDGTLSGVDTETMTVKKTVDLNAALAASGILGTALAARPALAHPRSLAITNNKDTNDADESIYVTEYFGVRKEAEAAGGANADTSKQGLVYKVKLSDSSVSIIKLAPLADMGFAPAPGATAGCYPNQLQSITLNDKYAYVVSVCASPKGPSGVRTPPAASKVVCTGTDITPCTSAGTFVEPACAPISPPDGTSQCVDLASVKTSTAPLLSAINLADDLEAPGTAASLNKKFFDFYAGGKAPTDNATRRMPLLANALAFVPGTGTGYVTANGTDAVFRMRFDPAAGGLIEVGGTENFIDLRLPTDATKQGNLPTGIAIGSKGFAFVNNDTSRNMSVLDFNLQQVAGGAANANVTATTAAPAAGSPEEKVVRGRRFFNTGLARWSLRGQGWGACQSCHVDGLSDNVTWYFGRGPRQTVSLDGSFGKKNPDTDQRIFNWTAVFDEVADFEGNTRGTSGGVGATVKATSAPPVAGDRIDLGKPNPANAERHDALNGSSLAVADPADPLGLGVGNKGVIADWLEVTAYIKTIRPPHGVTASLLDPGKVAAGRALFQSKNCNGCHGGEKWTISKVFYTRNFTTTEALTTKAWAVPTGFKDEISPVATVGVGGSMRTGKNGPNDSLQCILRHVGTFGVAEADVAVGGALPELRQDMTTAAQGGNGDPAVGRGFNPPSLLGVATGAPYFHGGNARTLEAALSDTFKGHHQPLANNFLDPNDTASPAQRAELVQFLLSIDSATAEIAPPATAGAAGGDFCVTP